MGLSGSGAGTAEGCVGDEALLGLHSFRWRDQSCGRAAENAVRARRGGAETVLVTGTTGRLGSHLLAQLLARPDVARVYALNRPALGASRSIEERTRSAFKLWGLDESLLTSDKVVLLVGDLTKAKFGLEAHVYDEVRLSALCLYVEALIRGGADENPCHADHPQRYFHRRSI